MGLHIATQNIWGRVPLWRLRKHALAKALRTADIAVLQEVQARGKASQAHDLALLLGLPHVHFASAGKTLCWREGVAIISRFPFLEVSWEKLPQNRRNLLDRIAPRLVLRALITAPLGTLEVFALHLSLAHSARTRAAEHVAAFAARQRTALPAQYAVFAGDFNAAPHEPCLKTLQARCAVTDIHAGPHPRHSATFPALWPLRRLDYLLISSNLRLRRVTRHRSLGSDHCAVIAHLEAA